MIKACFFIYYHLLLHRAAVSFGLKSPNMPLDQALLKGLSPRKGRETIKLVEYSPSLFDLSHFPRRVCPLNSFTLYQIYLSLSFISKRNDFGLVFTNLSNSPKISISTSKEALILILSSKNVIAYRLMAGGKEVCNDADHTLLM